MCCIPTIYFIAGKIMLLTRASNLFGLTVSRRVILPTRRWHQLDGDNLERIPLQGEPGIAMEPWLADNMLDGNFFLKFFLHHLCVSSGNAEDAKLLAVGEHYFEQAVTDSVQTLEVLGRQ